MVLSLVIFDLFLDFYIGEKGGTCNDSSHVIRSQAECMNAIQSVSNHVANIFNNHMVNGKWWTGSYKQIPSGCSINDGGKPFYENSATGVGNGREDLTPVCIDSSNSGNMNSKSTLFN